MTSLDVNLYISCFTSDFDIMRTKWSLKKSNGELDDSQMKRFNAQTGSILTYSWAQDKIVSETIQGCPFGMYTHEGRMYVCDAKHNAVVIYDAETLEVVETVYSKMFNDIHSIVRLDDDLLITSTGVDSLVKLSLKDHSVSAVVSFVKADNSLGIKISHDVFDGVRDFSKEHIETVAQLTHLNYAAPLSDGRIGISLFHQGKIIAYDPVDDSVEVIVDELFRSHSFFEYGTNFYVADSGNHLVKIYSRNDYRLLDTISYPGWVQDIKHIRRGGYDAMTVCDADNGVVYIYDLKDLQLQRTIQVASNYRLSSCELRM